jgi:hypothetical protein
VRLLTQAHGILLPVKLLLVQFFENLNFFLKIKEEDLDKELEKYFSSARKEIKKIKTLKAIIAPYS